MENKSRFEKMKRIKDFIAISTFIFCLYFLFMLAPTIIFVYCLIFTEYLLLRILAVIYLCWMINDRKTPEKGGRRLGWVWLRDKIRFSTARNYFPAKLIKTVDLLPNRNYLFAVFPHGVASCAVIFNFISFDSEFWKLYPRVRPRVLTIPGNYLAPISRDFALANGASAASPESIKCILTESNDPNDQINSDGFTSNAAILVVGGKSELYLSQPNEYRLFVKSRKGFVKQAIINGSPLVPVLSFGEVDLYNQPPNPPGSKYRKFQDFMKKKFNFPIGIFNGSFLLIPKRKPINTVVGAPIEVIQTENPSKEYINEIHEKFLNALTDLFEEHKSKYADDPEKCRLIFE